ncbi:MAG TPA: peptidylprolyl isomerase [Rhodocyclaceae bacterium]|jgi:peptidyl-prolyl cis-trans isomerase SurA|nr:peptidylprolyl isomerase [Betaproteobacteria bacterium]HMV00411.1 peptidylprolyl isomerase [Rhodocyclaceae bacterium]HMV20976.1 peptidylprolyl isomerase [Rhodocyclaceae bacterium]HMW77189.1 peptidylprolyl isomerase [Rhodocyclaceae bacterium]HNE43575.1 peptidylprolyl isomerase [Rhodocyclaceae bacterium]
MSIRLLRELLTLLAFAVLGLTSAAAVEPLEVDRIVAVVGDEVITMNELRGRLAAVLAQLKKQGTPLPPDDVLEKQMLERLIIDRVQLQVAKENGIRVDDGQLDMAMNRIAASNQMNLAQFRQAVEKDGIAYARFREEIRDEITVTRLREREVDSKLVISDSEIDNFLANQQVEGAASQIQLAHILMRAPESASPEQLQKLRARAEQVLARARAGENFAQLAVAFSDAPDGLSGGDLGVRPVDRLPSLYADAAAKLQPGDVSELLRSPAGFHIIKLVGRRGGASQPPVTQTRVRHILLRTNEVVSEAEARRKLENLRERLINGGDFQELARLYSQDGSAAKGGDLGWLNPGDTVPEFEKAMNELKENELSPVVQSPFGMHLIQVLERRQRDMSEERKRLDARQALRERKLDDAYQDWLRQLRDRTYVENRLEEK